MPLPPVPSAVRVVTFVRAELRRQWGSGSAHGEGWWWCFSSGGGYLGRACRARAPLTKASRRTPGGVVGVGGAAAQTKRDDGATERRRVVAPCVGGRGGPLRSACAWCVRGLRAQRVRVRAVRGARARAVRARRGLSCVAYGRGCDTAWRGVCVRAWVWMWRVRVGVGATHRDTPQIDLDALVIPADELRCAAPRGAAGANWTCVRPAPPKRGWARDDAKWGFTEVT